MLLIISVMMRTIMLNVIGMVEHVVTTKMMDGIPIAQNANVLVNTLFSVALPYILVFVCTFQKVILLMLKTLSVFVAFESI